MEFRFAPSMEQFEILKSKFKQINSAVEQKKPELVKKDASLGSIRCAFCDYSKLCWNDDSLKSYFKTFPKKKWPDDVKNLPLDAELTEKLENYIDDWDEAKEASDELKHIEAKILTILTNCDTNKIRTANGEVYDIKYLKSPRPHFELRKGKL